jgi:hypothetical protein
MVRRKATAKDDLQQTWKCLHRWSAFDVWIFKDVCAKKRRRLSVRKKRSALKNATILNKSLTRKPEREYSSEGLKIRKTTAKDDP